MIRAACTFDDSRCYKAQELEIRYDAQNNPAAIYQRNVDLTSLMRYYVNLCLSVRHITFIYASTFFVFHFYHISTPKATEYHRSEKISEIYLRFWTTLRYMASIIWYPSPAKSDRSVTPLCTKRSLSMDSPFSLQDCMDIVEWMGLQL